MSDPGDYTVGWICAISTEYTAAQCFLDEKHEQPAYVANRDGNDYTLGKMGRHNVVIAVLPDGEYGTTSAAAVAKDMVHSFPNVRIGLMVGIGGGAPSAKNDIRLGDVVVSSPANGKGGVFPYDMGKVIQGQGFQQNGFLNKPPTFLSTAVSGLKSQYAADGHEIVETIEQILEKRKRLKKTHKRPDSSTDKLYISTKVHGDQKKGCDAICGDEECDLIQRPERNVEEGDDDPVIFYGLIASADKVMKNASTRDLLAKEEDVLCFEMEAAGLMNHFPCLVVRGICDYSDSHKNKAWQGYAAMTAAAYTKDLLKRIPPNKIEAEKKISEVLSSVNQNVKQLSQDVKKIGFRMDKKEDQAILDWVAPDDYGSQQSHHLRRRHPGTGQWLLETGVFKLWSGGKGGSLFCRGMPGAGKTILTAVVVDNLLGRRGADNNDSTIGVAFLYCSSSQKEETTPEGLLLSVLRHLSQGLPSLPESVRALHRTHQAARTRPLLRDIVSCLKSIVDQYNRTFIIVDAIDECPSGCRPKLLKTLFHLRDAHGVNLLATSREHHEIEARFPKDSVLEINASPADVNQFLEAHMSDLPEFVSSQRDLQKMIKEVIVKAVCGMFLLAQLYLSSLVNKQSRREIERALADKNKTYKNLYRDTIDRIERSDQATFAKKALSWVVCARRPLTRPELLHALAVDPGDTSLDEHNLPYMDGVMSACAGLLSFDEGSDVVRLIHHTAQEYLEHGTGKATGTGKTTPLPGAEAYIASICTTYLSFDEFETGFCATDADLEDRLSKHPLYGYAARNWGYHAHNASVLPSNNTSVRRLLMSVPKTEAAGQGMMAIKEQSPWAGYSQEAPSGTTALHLAARFGATDIVTDLLKNYGIRECDVRDSHSQSPLMWAVVFGNVDMVQMLLDAGADPNSKDKDGRTSLSLAAESGFTAIIEALLKNNRLDMGGDAQKDSVGRLPLSWAARNGHVDAVSALLARSDLERGQADNPLLWAILQDSEAVVKVIVEAALGNQGAGPGWGARIAPKALCWAAEIGRVPVFTYLLSALGGDVNCRSDEDMTPLMKAAQNGHEEMATALTLRLGADPSLSDGRGRTAFSLAAAYGHDSLVSLFLLHADTKIDLNGVEKDGRTPLSLAAGNGHQTIVQTLLELEGEVVDVDARDKARQTPMFWAARNGYSSIVRRLLETGKVDIDLANVYRQTALSEAVKGYHVAASEAIKEYHAATIEVLREYGAADLGTEPASPESGRSYLTLSTEGPLAGESENNDDSGEEAPETDWGYQSDEFE